MASFVTFSDGTKAKASEVNSNLTRLPPIGGVIAWLKSYTNTPALPDGWVECNGQVLSDSESVYDGQTIPDLNGSGGTKRFLKGSTTSGTTGSGTHNHRTFYADTASGLLSYDSAGNLTGNIGAESTSGSNNVSGIDQAAVNGYLYTSQDVGDVPHYEVVWIMRVK